MRLKRICPIINQWTGRTGETQYHIDYNTEIAYDVLRNIVYGMIIYEEEGVCMDHDKIEQAVKLFLEGIGEDTAREGLKDTPQRIAQMCEELFGGYQMDAAEPLSRVFHSDTGDMVVEKDITFYSVCEHHLLPFFGRVHIGYIPDGRVVGLSKLARMVEVYARRAQIQEQLTSQIADALMKNLAPKGVMVMTEAEHMCMSMRGIKKPGSKTSSYAVRGVFEQDMALQQMFMQIIS